MSYWKTKFTKMEIYRFVVFLLFIGGVMYVIPKSGFEFDLYRIKLRLYPNKFKLIAIGWIIISILLAIFFRNTNHRSGEYLLSSINLSLFIFVFSKQKSEDEFSEQVRFKAVSYSFITFVAMVGAFGVISIGGAESNKGFDNLLLQILMGSALLMAAFYFYVTIYKVRKENN